jgi:isopentenyldiphosphate isomerase
MEYIDIVNKNGERLGLQKTKAEVHCDGDWHKTVHIWCINDKGEVLMQRRAADKVNFPNYWDISVAGHVDAHEQPVTSALREIREEIGISAEEDDLRYIGTVTQQFVLHEGTYIDNELCVIYLLKLNKELRELSMQVEELSALEWVPLTTLKAWVIEGRSDLLPHQEEYSLVFAELGI